MNGYHGNPIQSWTSTFSTLGIKDLTEIANSKYILEAVEQTQDIPWQPAFSAFLFSLGSVRVCVPCPSVTTVTMARDALFCPKVQ